MLPDFTPESVIQHACNRSSFGEKMNGWHPSMRMRAGFQLAFLLLLGSAVSAHAVSTETSNGCRGTQDDPCIRSGSCEIQGALWDQDVTVDRADIFDTQGWPGLCDMVHVGLVQGNCDPSGAQIGVTVQLSQTSTAWISADHRAARLRWRNPATGSARNGYIRERCIGSIDNCGLSGED